MSTTPNDTTAQAHWVRIDARPSHQIFDAWGSAGRRLDKERRTWSLAGSKSGAVAYAACAASLTSGNGGTASAQAPVRTFDIPSDAGYHRPRSNGPRGSAVHPSVGTSRISGTLEIDAAGTPDDRDAGGGAGAERAGVKTIEDAIAKMTAIGGRLPSRPGPGFGVYCFNRLYLAVTKAVKQAVDEASYFEQPARLAQLDVLFAQLYFDAVEANETGQHPPRAWRVLFEHSGSDDILPIQFAVAGMNAHINHDLPIALLEQWKLDGQRPPTTGPAYADYTKINQILKTEEAKEKTSLVPTDLHDVEELDHDLLGRIDSRLAMWVVETARAAAWKTADELWDCRHIPLAREVTLAALDRATAGWADAFLLPV